MQSIHGDLTLNSITDMSRILRHDTILSLAHARRVPSKKNKITRGSAGELSVGRYFLFIYFSRFEDHIVFCFLQIPTLKLLCNCLLNYSYFSTACSAYKKNKLKKAKKKQREIQVRFYMYYFNRNFLNNNMVFRILLHRILPYNVGQNMGDEDQEADTGTLR